MPRSKVTFDHTFTLSGQKVTFTDPRGIFWLGVTIDDSMPINVPGANPEDLDEVMFMAQDMASKALITQARSTMSSYFKKGSPKFKGIYWRGNSAKGISVMQTPSGSPGAVMYQIREHRASLRVIRQGLQPPNTRKPHQNQETFMQWIQDHKLKYREGIGAKEKTPSNEMEWKSVMWRVRQHIISYGIGKHWQQNATGAGIEGGKFNYPQYYRENDARQEMESIMETVFQHGDNKTGFRALIDTVVWGSLSAARFQTSGKQKVNTKKDHGIGHKYRKQNLWQNYAVAFSDEDTASEVTETWADKAYSRRVIKRISSPVPTKKR